MPIAPEQPCAARAAWSWPGGVTGAGVGRFGTCRHSGSAIRSPPRRLRCAVTVVSASHVRWLHRCLADDVRDVQLEAEAEAAKAPRVAQAEKERERAVQSLHDSRGDDI